MAEPAIEQCVRSLEGATVHAAEFDPDGPQRFRLLMTPAAVPADEQAAGPSLGEVVIGIDAIWRLLDPAGRVACSWWTLFDEPEPQPRRVPEVEGATVVHASIDEAFDLSLHFSNGYRLKCWRDHSHCDSYVIEGSVCVVAHGSGLEVT